jgi:3-phosphoshikimate 1-carboxyvinyltransferase
MSQLTLGPVRNLRGELHLPGSKSLSNRALLLAALAGGRTSVDNLLFADDTERMLSALARLGVRVDVDRAALRATVDGIGGAFATGEARIALDLGNAGTAVRPLVAVLCFGHGRYHVDGTARMRERPIADLTDALASLGAHITFAGSPGYPPLDIDAAGLDGGRVGVRGDTSSQFLTALLMAAPLARTPLSIALGTELVSKPYVDITLATMSRFGIDVAVSGGSVGRAGDGGAGQCFTVPLGTYRSPGRFLVEGDASAATYFLAGAAVAGGPVRVHGIGRHSVQGDVAFVDVLRRMGAGVVVADDWIEVRRGAANRLAGIDADLNHIPDAAMTLATLALFADGPTRIRNVGNWRVKETDRLAAMATELRKLGAAVDEGADWIAIEPPARLRSAAIDTYDDHRMAMAFSLAALGGVAVTINDPECVGKTFPAYFEEFARLAVH